MTLDELRRLNFRDIGGWPVGPKIGLLVLIVAAILALGAYFDWYDQYESLERERAEELALRDQFTAKKKQAVNLDIYLSQLREIEQSLSVLLKQLPNRSEMDALLTDINQAGLGRGLQFELFKPSAERVADFYAELPIAIKVSGNYHDFGAFASDVAQLPRIVTLNDLAITVAGAQQGPQAVGSGALTLEAIARTYRYLDEEELAKQKQQAKEAKGGAADKGAKK
jgi:type IV pilus assembly protein PilO